MTAPLCSDNHLQNCVQSFTIQWCGHVYYMAKIMCRGVRHVQTMVTMMCWGGGHVNNNNNVHVSCAHQRPEHSHDIY